MDTGVIRIELDTFAHRGEAIGRQDGQVVFVAGGIPGETVDVEVYQRKHDFLRGRVRDVVSSSADRVLPPCPYFGVCGGCQLQHVAYSRQLALKEEVVRDQMRRIGAFPNPEVRPPLGMDHPW
nr:TRAM domain-containing protein [Dehalococcoidales bacterium]